MTIHKAVEPLEGSTNKKAVDPKKVIEVTAFLGYPDQVLTTVPEIAGKTVEDRRHWSRQELQDLWDKNEWNVIKKWAEDNNLQETSIAGSARVAKIKGTVKNLEKTFDVKMVEYRHKEKGDYYTYEGNVKLPPFIHSIHGLDNRRIAEHHLSKGRKPAAGSNSFLAPEVAKGYNFPPGTGSGETVAIIELGGGFSASDLTSYWKLASITNPPKVTAVGVDGAVNQPGDPSGADVEVLLDIEIPGSVATGANFVVYFAPNTDQGFINAVTTAAHDIVNKPSVISISWGGPEDQWAQSTIAAMGQAFQACAAMGITVFAASGDNGITDGERGLHVDYPASDPFVTGCGATNISSLSPLVEQGWQDAGGGVSAVFPIPAWQTTAIPGATKRGVPDVAGLGGTPGFIVVADGQTGPVEGTSCVAPLWAGLTAIINGTIGKSVGFLNPLIYQNAKTFNDITTGNNGFAAGPGWDAVTGLGTPNGLLLLKALQGGSGPPTPQPTLTVPASLSYHLKENTQTYITLAATDNISGITSIQYGVVHPVANGTLVTASGATSITTTYFYNPNTNFTGSDFFTYQATDNIGTKSNIGQINFTVVSTSPPQTRYQLRTTQYKGEPVQDAQWKNVFDSGVLQ